MEKVFLKNLKTGGIFDDYYVIENNEIEFDEKNYEVYFNLSDAGGLIKIRIHVFLDKDKIKENEKHIENLLSKWSDYEIEIVDVDEKLKQIIDEYIIDFFNVMYEELVYEIEYQNKIIPIWSYTSDDRYWLRPPFTISFEGLESLQEILEKKYGIEIDIAVLKEYVRKREQELSPVTYTSYRYNVGKYEWIKYYTTSTAITEDEFEQIIDDYILRDDDDEEEEE